MIAGHIEAAVLGALSGVFLILIAASAVVASLVRRQPEKDHTELRQRVRSWWVIIGVFSAAFLLSRTASLVLLGFVSFLALKEYFSLIPSRRADRRVMFWAYLAIPIQYYWVASAWYGMFIIFIPVYMFLFLPLRMVIAGEVQGFLRAVGVLHWGLMVTVFGISHMAFLLVLPDAGNPGAGGAGLLLYLLFLTQFNDVAQYVWGRRFGRRKVVPTVSPNKTAEGLLGGVATTTVLALALAPWLTPFGPLAAALAGLAIGLAGFAGDVTISAVKRDLGVKDSGSLLPGHGGILDRIDSLTFTAPLFFHFVWYAHY